MRSIFHTHVHSEEITRNKGLILTKLNAIFLIRTVIAYIPVPLLNLQFVLFTKHIQLSLTKSCNYTMFKQLTLYKMFKQLTLFITHLMKEIDSVKTYL